MGGAVSMELAKMDSRVIRSVNIDGGVFGKLRLEPSCTPSLMIYSDENEDTNELALAKDDVSTATVAGSRHLNFHDISQVLPSILRLLCAVGKGNVQEIVEERNQLIEGFLSNPCNVG